MDVSWGAALVVKTRRKKKLSCHPFHRRRHRREVEEKKSSVISTWIVFISQLVLVDWIPRINKLFGDEKKKENNRKKKWNRKQIIYPDQRI